MGTRGGWTTPPEGIDTSAWMDDDWLSWYRSPEAEAKYAAELEAAALPLLVCDWCDGDGCEKCDGW